MSKMNKSPAKWINESTWKECLQLSSSISAFAGLCSNIAVNGALWSKFSTCENPFQYLEDSSSAVEGTNLKKFSGKLSDAMSHHVRKVLFAQRATSYSSCPGFYRPYCA